MDPEGKQPLFQDIDGEQGQQVTSVESLCMACEENVSFKCGQHILISFLFRKQVNVNICNSNWTEWNTIRE